MKDKRIKKNSLSSMTIFPMSPIVGIKSFIVITLIVAIIIAYFTLPLYIDFVLKVIS